MMISNRIQTSLSLNNKDNLTHIFLSVTGDRFSFSINKVKVTFTNFVYIITLYIPIITTVQDVSSLFTAVYYTITFVLFRVV